jgi:hypothetical protein
MKGFKRPLFVGFHARWDGEGYISIGEESFNVGTHLQKNATEMVDEDTIRISSHHWYAPDPEGWGEDYWDTLYSILTLYPESSGPSDPAWKWGSYWILPFDYQLINGQTTYIDGQPFRVYGPYPDVSGIPYWVLINESTFLFWDGGGDWTQYVHPGDITLYYYANQSRLRLHRNVFRRYYYKGGLTSYSVQYISSLTSTNAFSGANATTIMPRPPQVPHLQEDSPAPPPESYLAHP